MTRRLAVLVAAAAVASALPTHAAAAQLPMQARSISAPVRSSHTFRLPLAATHVALHWRGARDARVGIAVGPHGRFRPVELDEASEQRGARETYGAVMLARGARLVRVRTSQPLARMTVLAIRDRGAASPTTTLGRSSAFGQPTVLRRADWQADESLRFDSGGHEVWPAAYYPVQKLIVHHTAGQNNDPDPPATIRAIYYYHAVTQGWGDIGYNFLIDEQGRVYEGRHTLDYPLGASPTEEDANGNVVTAAHAQGFNSGTVGIALLGTLTNQDATPAARAALEKLLAWEADRHAIDPNGASLYTNPVNGTQKTFPNIAGHRDVGATECPGGVFYATLPAIRNDVASMLAGSPPPPAVSPTVVTGSATAIARTGATLNGSVNPQGAATTYWFQYGTTTSYSASTSATAAGSGTVAVTARTTIGGLTRATTYHYRLVAANSAGTSYGADRSFRTKK